ncbi:MAG: hypothetical protein OEU54_00015 [Gemmatimonadota bacterium]|nr:hypothetical protein [Gemmatimonadota bacterium]
MTSAQKEHLDEANIARQRLFESDKSSLQRYAELVIGEYSLWRLIRYELISLLILPVPGALGIALRRLFCPALFRSVGRNPVFGRDITLRNAHRVSLGDDVVIDDRCLVDGRGAGEEGIELGDNVILHRAAVVISKGGGIRVRSGTDIGSYASIISQGGIDIGESVSIAGGCRIGGGLVDSGTDGANRYTTGPVRIGDSVTVLPAAIVLDGVEVGAGAVVGAAAVVREDVPPNMTFAPYHRGLMVPHGEKNGSTVDEEATADAEAGEATDTRETSRPAGGGPTPPVITATLLEAVAELNETRSADTRIALSPDTRLIGGELDSLALVNFIVSAEARLERAGIYVDLAATTSSDQSHLRTISTLADFVARSTERPH